MTCTTHHICDCLKERMEKLERIAEAAIRLTQPSDWANFNKRVALVKAVDDLEQP